VPRAPTSEIFMYKISGKFSGWAIFHAVDGLDVFYSLARMSSGDSCWHLGLSRPDKEGIDSVMKVD